MSVRPASNTASPRPWDAVLRAIASKIETAAMGFFKASANALIAAKPTRRPVNDPGPETTAKAARSFLLPPCFSRSLAICGTSCAENAPPSRDRTSRISMPLWPWDTRASAMLPFLPEVSIARRSIDWLNRAHHRGHGGFTEGTGEVKGDRHGGFPLARARLL